MVPPGDVPSKAQQQRVEAASEGRGTGRDLGRTQTARKGQSRGHPRDDFRKGCTCAVPFDIDETEGGTEGWRLERPWYGQLAKNF